MPDDLHDVEQRVLETMKKMALPLEPSLIHLQRPIKDSNHNLFCAYCHLPTVKPAGERCDSCGSRQRITKQNIKC